MKANRVWFYLLVLAFAALTIYLLHHPAKPKLISESGTASNLNQSAEPNNGSATTNTKSHITALMPEEKVAVSNNAVTTRETQMQQDIASKNSAVDFYGQCVDQNIEPVSGVKIAMNVRHNEFSPLVGMKASYPSKEFVTDLGGRFEWVDANATGDILSLGGVEKTGYLLSPNAPKNFAAQTGSLEKPVIFKMWKKGEPQNLTSHNLSRLGVPVDGSEIRFDLFTGEKVQSDGQLIIRIKRNPEVLPPGNSGYDWSAEFEIPNGGLIASDDDFMYSAPENGYQETYKIDMPKGSDSWKPTFDQNFYIELDNGKIYGMLTVHLLTFHSPPPIILNLGMRINPNGSRNLQP